MLDKRHHIRVPLRIPVSCEVAGDVVFDAVTSNIGLGGTCLQSSDTVSDGAKLMVVAHLPGAKKLSHLPATVRWVKQGVFGVQFGVLGVRDTYRIADLLGVSMRPDPRE